MFVSMLTPMHSVCGRDLQFLQFLRCTAAHTLRITQVLCPGRNPRADSDRAARPSAKPWKGEGADVMEIVSDFDSDTFRAVYTVTFKEAIYVLHCFQKKSPRGKK